MADISKLNLTGSDLDIKDSVARQKLTVVDPSEGEGLITFGVDSNGNYGYKKVGADTVTPFKTSTPSAPTISNFINNIINNLSSGSSVSLSSKRKNLSSEVYVSVTGSLSLKPNDFIGVLVCHNNDNIQFVVNDDSSLTELTNVLSCSGPTCSDGEHASCYLFFLKVLKSINAVTKISMTRKNTTNTSYFYTTRSDINNAYATIFYITS